MEHLAVQELRCAIVPPPPIGVCLGLATSAESHIARSSLASATSLRIAYFPRVFHLKYELGCEPPTGTLPRARAACTTIARAPSMVFPPPAPSQGIRLCKPPSWTLTITGRYRGRRVDAQFAESCDDSLIGSRWLRYLPSEQELEGVRVDRGLGPLELGEPAAAMRALLGPPDHRKGRVDVYDLGVVAQVHQGAPVIFVVGYGRSSRVTSLIYDGFPRLYGEPLSLPPRSGSPVLQWRMVECGGHVARADHRLLPGQATTLVWSSVDHPTAIVTSAPAAACAVAAATAPAGCRPDVPCVARYAAGTERVARRA